MVGINVLRCFCTFSFVSTPPKIKNRRQILTYAHLKTIDPFSSGRETTPLLPKASRVSRAAVERGSAILEAGLLLPVLILMASGAMDFARVFFAGIVVESAARAGVQSASFSVGDAGATSKSNAAAQSDASGQGLTGITVSSRTFCACAPDPRK